MIEILINDYNLEKFINDIRETDKEELKYFFKKDYKEKFKELCLKTTNSYFVSDNALNPIAIGGFQETGNKNEAQVWLICSNKLKNNKKELYKYIKNKVETNKKKYDVIFNFIYKSNFRSLNFLKKLGFKILNLKDKNFKFFYLTKGEEKIDLRHFAD